MGAYPNIDKKKSIGVGIGKDGGFNPYTEQSLMSIESPVTAATSVNHPKVNLESPKPSQLNSRDYELIDRRVIDIKSKSSFDTEYNNVTCFRTKVNSMYVNDSDAKIRRKYRTKGASNINDANYGISNWAFKNKLSESQTILRNCLLSELSKKQNDKANKNTTSSNDTKPNPYPGSPFDRRLDRLFISGSDKSPESVKIPFSFAFKETATAGLLVDEEYLIKNTSESVTNPDGGFSVGAQSSAGKAAVEKLRKDKKLLKNNILYTGVPSLINTYAVTKLYGSEGGAKLINKRGERRWYEVDEAFGTGSTGLNAFSMNPTTSSLISWGNADPYGRTPYHFTDFVFSKHWKKIENNRLITLRRFGAPILDNLKFPGMNGDKNTTKTLFPPMAHAITYFGEDTGNSLNKLLGFSTGLNWDEVKSNVWKVGTESSVTTEAGPGKLYKGLSTFARMVNVVSGESDPERVLNDGNLPPDPYTEGPYENRILGPVNRIDSVKKRAPGLLFEWSGLNLTFDYVARPIGGVNTKAVLLDILSNFLIIGSASAMFFGGQHRFMGQPGKYPFLGGDKGIKEWYQGNPIGWAKTTIGSFTNQIQGGGGESGINTSFLKDMGKQFSSILGSLKGSSISDLLGGIGDFGKTAEYSKLKNLGGDILSNVIAEKASGQVPYLSGLKALLTGEPVGEWHVTIGNPLNPIAMIGNLICNGIEIEFGEELGPDDFPTELKIIVKLDHGMPRDRDAIQSVFNRGMGRIYDLPDKFEGSADGQTPVDNYTSTSNETGTAALSRGWMAGPSTVGSRSGPAVIEALSNKGKSTVWSHAPFRAVSPNEDLTTKNGEMARSTYRSVDWLALKSLK